MFRLVVVFVSVMVFGMITGAYAQTNPQANKILVKACGFSLEPTPEAPHPMPVGDGSFYYITPGQLDDMLNDAFDFESCDWEKVVQDAYDYQPPVQPESVVATPQPTAPKPTPDQPKTYSPERQARIEKNRDLIRTCGFLSVPTDERDIRMSVGDGTYYYVSYTEQKGITNPLSGFKPCPEAEQDPAVFASMDKAAEQAGMNQSRDALNELGVGATTASPQQTASSNSQTPIQSQSSDLNVQLDKVISVDARSWLFNRYNVGSARNARITDYDPASGLLVVYGEYTYNSASTGWIKVVFDGEQVNCVEYHDFRGTCRALGNNPAAYVALGAVAVAAAGSSGPSGNYSSGDSYSQCVAQCNSSGYSNDPGRDAAFRSNCISRC